MGRRKSRLPKVIAVAIVGLGVWGAVSTNRGCGGTAARSNKAIVLNPTTRTTPPATRPAVEAAGTDGSASGAAVASATSKPLAATRTAEKRVSRMTINNVLVEFPEAKLLVRKEGDKLSACLVSNDPPEVLSPNYQGNRYYFEMALDNVTDVKDIGQADFRYKGATAESEDTPNGIFLDGDRQHFQPYDIQVVFDREGDQIVADIRGQFLYFAKGSAVAEWVPVVAQLTAKPEIK